jgi:zinc protease
MVTSSEIKSGLKLFGTAAMWILFVLLVCVLSLPHSASHAASPNILEIKTDKGVGAWLVREPSIPIISVQITFRGGTITDPVGKEGLANMVAGLLDEGAGEFDSSAFQERLQELAIGFSARANKDTFRVGMRTLVEHRDEAFRMLGLALSEPRFDPQPVERIRQQITVGLIRDAEDPDRIANHTWFAKAFPDHVYGRPNEGSIETIAAITRVDLAEFTRSRFARDNAIIGVVGDITPEDLSRLLDVSFDGVAAAAGPVAISETMPSAEGSVTVIRKQIPQSVVTFGLPGIKRDDPDYYAAYIMNYILGGGGFTSRLFQEVREKRGLAYSVYTYLYPYDYSAIYLGGVATVNARVDESLNIIQAQIAALAENGITAGELERAKTFLNGSFPLRLDSNAKIARILVGIQLNNLGKDYIQRRPELINVVTLEDIQRIAKRLLGSGSLTIVVVGDPVGIQNDG